MDLRKRTVYVLTKLILQLEIERRNFQFLNKAYNKLGLYDNKRIIETNKKYRKTQAILTDSLFENVIEIILEEICEKDNQEILDLFMQYYLNRFPMVEEQFEKNKGNRDKYLKAFKKDADGDDAVKKTYIILHYVIYAENDEKFLTEIYFKYKTALENGGEIANKGYTQILEEYWGVKNLKENKIYQKYLKKQRGILAEYLEIEPDNIEEYIVKISASTYADMEKEELCTPQGFVFSWMEESLFKIMDKLNVSTDCIVGKAEKQHAIIVTENFENLCGALLFYKCKEYGENGVELTLSMIIRQASIEDASRFYVGLVSAFYFELLGRVLNKVLESYYKVFSFDKELGYNREKELLEEISKLQNDTNHYKEQLRQHMENEFQNRKKQYSEQKSEDREYVEQINLLKKQLEEQINENEKQSIRIKDQQKYIELLEMPEEKRDNEKVDMTLITDKNIVFIGGMQETLVKLRVMFPNAVFINDEAITTTRSMDMIVMFPKFMNHVLFYKYIAVARENKIPTVYCNSTNIEVIQNDMYAEYTRSVDL